MSANTPAELQRIYAARFEGNLEYRKQVWRTLIANFFQSFVRTTDAVLDLGCGYGEFIRQITCGQKYAMDLNPDAPLRAGPEVRCLVQDCSLPWPLADASLDVVFTSNFFEHLPDKAALGRTLDEIQRCLKFGGVLIALGPNIKCSPGAYWDFWDHHVPLTEQALAEALEHRGFCIEVRRARFLPFTMAHGRRYPLVFVRWYLKLRICWALWGKQFLVIAAKEAEQRNPRKGFGIT